MLLLSRKKIRAVILALVMLTLTAPATIAKEGDTGYISTGTAKAKEGDTGYISTGTAKAKEGDTGYVLIERLSQKN